MFAVSIVANGDTKTETQSLYAWNYFFTFFQCFFSLFHGIKNSSKNSVIDVHIQAKRK